MYRVARRSLDRKSDRRREIETQRSGQLPGQAKLVVALGGDLDVTLGLAGWARNRVAKDVRLIARALERGRDDPESPEPAPPAGRPRSHPAHGTGALLDGKRLCVYAHGRIEGVATLAPKRCAPRSERLRGAQIRW